MKNILCLVAGLLALVLAGCGNNVLSTLDQTRVQDYRPTLLDSFAEDILEEAFLETGLPWETDNIAQINSARSSLMAIKKRIDTRTMLNTSLPYYNYRAAVEDTYMESMNLLDGLDYRAAKEGALTRQGAELYRRIRQDFTQELDWQKGRLATETENIQKVANKADMADLQRMYKAIEPLVGVVKGAI